MGVGRTKRYSLALSEPVLTRNTAWYGFFPPDRAPAEDATSSRRRHEGERHGSLWLDGSGRDRQMAFQSVEQIVYESSGQMRAAARRCAWRSAVIATCPRPISRIDWNDFIVQHGLGLYPFHNSSEPTCVVAMLSCNGRLADIKGPRSVRCEGAQARSSPQALTRGRLPRGGASGWPCECP